MVGPAGHDQDAVRERALQAAQRLVPAVAAGRELGEHRSEFRGHRAALRDPGVHTKPRSGRRPEQRHDARRGRESAVGVFRVQADLDGMPGAGRRHGREAASPGHVDLELHQIDAAGELRDDVLDLETRVRLQEIEPSREIHEELDAHLVPVLRGGHEPHGGVGERRLEVRGEACRRRLRHEFLEPALQRAVSGPDGPDRPVAVRLDLHLDVAHPGHPPLEEHRAVVRDARRLAPERAIRGLQVRRRRDAPDRAAAGSPARLERHRVAERLGLRQRGIERVGGRVAPRNHRNPRLLGQALRADLVAQPPHRPAVGTDDDHAQALAHLRELGPLGHESPPRPDRIRLRLGQAPLEDPVVEVRRAPQPVGVVHVGRRPEVDGLVGLAHEPGVPVRLREQGDDADAAPMLQVVFADRMNEPHRGFAAVHDRDSAEVSGHACLDGGPTGTAGRPARGGNFALYPGAPRNG